MRVFLFFAVYLLMYFSKSIFMYTLEQIIKKAREVHGDKYDYSKAVYKKLILPIEIICPKHGSFFQSPHQHINKQQGCPKCGIENRVKKKTDSKETFIEKARKIHGDKYDYSKVEYERSNKKVCIICPEHGEFWTKPNWHINGRGCPECGKLLLGKARKLSQEEFIERAKEKYGNKFDYSKVEYENSSTKVCIICPKHGEFFVQAGYFLDYEYGCPECARDSIAEKRKKTTEWFIEKAREMHGYRYDYSKTIYNGCNKYVTITCPIHGDFQQIASYHINGNGCQKCGESTSQKEEELYNFVSSLLIGKRVLKRNRKVLSGQELDVYVPSKKIAFEYDGLYWHNEVNKPDPEYHLKKTETCLSKGIQLIHIFEDEWLTKKEICESRIRNLLGVTKNKIYARKCKIIDIDNVTAKNFINENHIQGYIGGKYNYGLEYNGKLVSVITFSTLRKNLGSKNEEDSYELLRFCNKLNTSVVGGASKLFKHFIKTVHPIKIISYCDRRWGEGNLYKQIGFEYDHTSKPNYFYVIKGIERKNRFNYRKDILISKYGCPKEMSEHEFCLKNNWYRIYDCGTNVYIWHSS